LTGLLNRYAFLEQLGAVIEAAPEGRQMIALMDLNRFKEVNDSFGHQAGDAVLEKLGARLRELMAHRNAFVARLNGDEIVVCADPQAWPGGIASLCDDLRATVQRTFMVNETSFELTATIGIALYPDDAQTPEHLVRCADIAMYAAKRAMVASERYSQSQVRVTPHSLALKSDFARAIRDGSLSLAWQPKVRLSDGALVGFEALSRWTHPVEGPISPGVFVPLAETTELVHPFTRQVIRGALQQLDAWQQAGCLASISVNISANNLLRVDFVDEVRTLLAEFGTPAGRLEFEVTESALMHEPEAALARLCELRDLGVVLSIDDFGTGYSSLGYLKRLPVKVLKIDRAFIASLQTEDADRRIVEWSIQLAHSFGMEVVAEGVETQEVAALLKAMGCDIAQGYYFGRPATAEVVAARWLTAAYVG